MRPSLDLLYPILTDNSALSDIVASVDDKVNRTLRHIRSRIHRLREAVRRGYIRSSWIRKEAMLADVLTKCMQAPSFRDKLVVAALTSSSSSRAAAEALARTATAAPARAAAATSSSEVGRGCPSRAL
jgi:hypothetical protein